MRTIIYGKAASGKTQSFNEKIRTFDGRVIAISNFKENKFEFTTMILGENIIEEDLNSSAKIHMTIKEPYEEFKINKDLETTIEYLYNTDLGDEKILLAIDGIEALTLRGKITDNDGRLISIVDALLNMTASNGNIELYITTQSLKSIKRLSPIFFEGIKSDSKIISTRTIDEYSGEIKVRIDKLLHKQITECADIEGVTLNKYIETLFKNNLNIK